MKKKNLKEALTASKGLHDYSSFPDPRN